MSVSVTLSALLAAGPAGGEPRLLEIPSAYERALAYPDLAQAGGVPGEVVLRCRVNGLGRPAACQVHSESPRGYGFGKAAMSLRSKFRLSPPPAGGDPWVLLPIHFDADPSKRLKEGDPNR